MIDPPPEFRLGRLIDIWAVDGRSSLDALRSYAVGRRRWLATTGVGPYLATRRLPNGAPWSVRGLVDAGRGHEVDVRLRRAGVSRRDLPALRRSAQGWLHGDDHPAADRH